MALTLSASSTQREVTAKMVLLGLGLGPTIPLYTIAIQNAVPLHQLGVATSTVTFFRQLGSTVGLAVVGSLFGATLTAELDARMGEATKGLPAAMVQRFAGGPGSADGEGGPTRGRFDAVKVKAQVDAQLEGAQVLAHKALQGDGLATTLVAQSPLADERLKATAEAGGVQAQVAAQFVELRRRLSDAAQSPEAWAALRDSGELPAAVQAQVAQVPPSVMADPKARENALAGLALGVNLAQVVAEQVALSEATTRVDGAIERARAQAHAAVDAVAAALKESFTLGLRRVFRVALLLTVLAFLLTLRLPQLALRSTSSPPVPAAGE
jgi:hypothetical protein